MDPPDDVERAGRARRAVPLIAAALTIAVVAGLLYLRPPPAPRLALVSPSPSAPTLAPAYAPAYYFVTPSLGWAVLERDETSDQSEFWIYRTQDGAAHWSLQQKGTVEARPGIDIRFFDRGHGMVVFGETVGYRTADGGAHWTHMPLPAMPGAQVVFVDPAHGWYAWSDMGKGGPLHLSWTVDGGSSWRLLPDPPGMQFSFRNASEGWVGAVEDKGGGDIYATWDGGETWDRATPTQGPPLVSVTVLPGKGVLAMAGDGTGYTSFDHGATWNQIPGPPAGATFPGVAFQDATHWWTMPFGNLYRTSDAGQSWQHITLRLDDWKYALGVIDANHAWARLDPDQISNRGAGFSGLALTADGGRTWNYAKVPVPG